MVIATIPPCGAQTILDHVTALQRYSRHRVFVYNHFNLLRFEVGSLPPALDLGRFDVVVIHYSTWLLDEDVDYLDGEAKQKLAEFGGLKVLFRQDEYMHVNGLIKLLQTTGVNVLFTTFSERDATRIYTRPGLEGLRKVRTLTGYVPESLLGLSSRPIAGRPIDVGYRSRRLPFWLGSLAQEKALIADRFSVAAARFGLKCDISSREQDRLYGRGWIDFNRSCKVVLGTESGASVVDFTGGIQRNTESYIDHYPDATFEEVRDLFFADKEGEYNLAQISPRCFEAAALKTGMVLYEGEYSGFLQPWRHYIPLRKDFSNMDEVVRAIKDTALIQRLVDQTYKEVALNPQCSYRNLVAEFDSVIEEELAVRMTRRAVSCYESADFLRTVGQRSDYSHALSWRVLWFLGRAKVPHAWTNAKRPLGPLRLASDLAFREGQGLVNATDGPACVNEAVALDDQPLPQRIVVHLPSRATLQSVAIEWGSSRESARDFAATLYRGSTIAKTFEVRENESNLSEFECDGVVCDWISVSITAFNGSPRLTLRLVEVRGYLQPSLSRRLWRKLPPVVRFIVRRSKLVQQVRAITQRSMLALQRKSASGSGQ